MTFPLRRLCLCILCLATTVPALAGDDAAGVEERLRDLEERVRAQDEEIRRLREEMARQSEALPAIEQELDRLLGKVEDESFWQQPGTMRAYFKDGLWFETADKAFQIRIGGRLNLDAAGYRADSKLEEETGAFESETGFRRARLIVSGRLFTRTIFKAEYDFAGSDVKFRDVWMGHTDVPILQTVRVGHQKEPFSQEQLMSGSATFFLERSLADAFAPKRNTGVLAESKAFEDRLVWSYGLFTDTDDAGEGPIGRGITARVAGVPWLDRELRAFALVGLSGSHRRPREHEFRFSSRPESNFAPNVADTETFEADRANFGGLDGAVVLGPLTLAAEYVLCALDGASGGDPRFSGGYVYAGWTLTGESRPWAKGLLDKVKPERNFPDDGPGAVEIGVRWSWIDLSDGAIRGGDMDDFTLGVNWWLNPLTRVMLNWVHSRLRHFGEADSLAIRFQIPF